MRAPLLLFSLALGLSASPAWAQPSIGQAWEIARPILCLVLQQTPTNCSLPQDILIPVPYPQDRVARAGGLYLAGTLQGADYLLRDMAQRLRGPALRVYWGLTEEERERLEQWHRSFVPEEGPKQEVLLFLHTASFPQISGGGDLLNRVLVLVLDSDLYFHLTGFDPGTWLLFIGTVARQLAPAVRAGIVYFVQAGERDRKAREAERAPDGRAP